MGCAELRKLLLLLLLLHVAWHRVVLPVEDKPSQSLKEAILAGGKKVGAAPAVGISLSNHLSAVRQQQQQQQEVEHASAKECVARV
jgi:hypothetical protein